MPFGGTLVDVETLEAIPSQSNHRDVDDDMSEEVLAEFFGPSTCCTGTFPEHAQQNYQKFCMELTPVPLAEPLQFPSSKGMTLRQYYEQNIHRTSQQCLEEFLSPQRSDAWKLARKFSLTASDFGAAAGQNVFQSPEDLLEKKLKVPFQGNQATQWGCAMEPRAGEAFLQFARRSISGTARLYDVNLVKFSSSSWLAVSPDNVLYYKDVNGKEHWDLVEYKCPVRDSGPVHPYKKYKGNIPPYYKCQMLGIWGHCNDNGGIYIRNEETQEITQHFLEKVWFVVWQPERLWVTPFFPQVSEWRTLHEQLRGWYFEKFLPSLYALTQE
jgi:putative phage-type endonuclease